MKAKGLSNNVDLTALSTGLPFHFTGVSPLQIVLLQTSREAGLVREKVLKRPIIHSVCDVDTEVFNLSFSLCFYRLICLTLSVLPSVYFVSTIINHL